MRQKKSNRAEVKKIFANMYLLNLLDRFHTINIDVFGEPFTPTVGVFWMDLAELKIYSANTFVDDAEHYGDFKVHSAGHYDVWPQIVLLNPKWKWTEYEDVPRGRVVFHNNKKQSKFLVYLCPDCSGNTAIMARIIDEFKLPEGFIEFRFDDEHYVIDNGMKTDVESVDEIDGIEFDSREDAEDSYYDIPVAEARENSATGFKDMTISRFTYGLKCRKLLWTFYHNPSIIPCHYDGTGGLFYDEAANAELAHSLFPDIISVDHKNGNNAEEVSRQLLAGRNPVFKAVIRHDDSLVTIDILKPAINGKWDIIQFSSKESSPLSCSAKPRAVLRWLQNIQRQNVQDIAFQLYCCEKSGIPIRKCYLVYINHDYIRRGALDAGEMLILEDVTDNVIAESVDIETRLADIRRTIAEKECPPFEMYENGADCLSAFHCAQTHCPLRERCMEIVHGKRAPMTPITDADYDILKIRDFMEALVYPLHFLDIQYFNRVIPIDGNKPNALLPFACSLQSVDTISAKPVTHSWIWDGSGDSRSLMLEKVREWFGNHGSIIIRNEYSKTPLAELFTLSPDYQSLNARMIELVQPFNKRILGELASNGIDLFQAVFQEMKITDFNYTNAAEFIQSIYNKQNNLNQQHILQRIEENCRVNSELMLYALRKYAEFLPKVGGYGRR